MRGKENEKHKGGSIVTRCLRQPLVPTTSKGDDEATDWPQQRAMAARDKRRESEVPIKQRDEKTNEKHKGVI